MQREKLSNGWIKYKKGSAAIEHNILSSLKFRTVLFNHFVCVCVCVGGVHVSHIT